MTELMASVATMGADRDLDVVATSRYVFASRAHHPCKSGLWTLNKAYAGPTASTTPS